MTAVLRVQGLTRFFGGVRAVSGVEFEVAPGELKALIGPNGAGKSTCFNMLMGQLRPSSGEVFLNGKRITGLPPRDIWRRGVGRTFQITATYQSMTVAENVQMALISHHRRLFSFLPYARPLYRDEAMALLNVVGMADQADRSCAVLAYGDLKRLELAIALSHDPTLLLMDEPTAGMAPKERIALMQLTADDMDVVFTHAHHIMVLNRGELIADGTAAQVRANARVQEVYLGGGTLYAAEDAHA
jgi:branched-chain amino acid transport system ATP-binding protein